MKWKYWLDQIGISNGEWKAQVVLCANYHFFNVSKDGSPLTIMKGTK